jgi:tRNA A37 N6-isopentenylltransferase MiaA
MNEDEHIKIDSTTEGQLQKKEELAALRQSIGNMNCEEKYAQLVKIDPQMGQKLHKND